MNIKIIVILLILSNLIFATQISQSGVAVALSKNEACHKALLQAQQEALYQSGINIFSSFEKKQINTNDKEIKNIINYNLQTSYGYIKTISKNEETEYNPQTGYITCKINGIFEVDTSKLKSQLLALTQKYNNEYKQEISRAEVLRKKENLMQKYFILKKHLTQPNVFYYTGNYNCGDVLSLEECKNRLRNKIKSFIKQKLATKYNIDSSLVKIGSLKLLNTIKYSIKNNELITKYNGKLEVKASSVKNPYINEINSLNAFLGEKLISDDEENNKQKSLSLVEVLSNKYDTVHNFLSFREKYIIYNGYPHIDGSAEGNIGCLTFLINMKSKYFFKFGLGNAKYKKKHHEYIVDSYNGEDYSYKFYSLGISTFLLNDKYFKISIDTDYIIPYASSDKKYLYTETNCCTNEYDEKLISNNKKNSPFFNLSMNFDWIFADNILLGTGFVIGGDKAWYHNWWVFRAGIIF